MYCKRCGKAIADDSTFCRYCGTVQDTEETVEVEEHFDFLDMPTQPKKRRTTSNRRRTKKKLSVVVVCIVLAAVILVGAFLLLPREKSAAQIAKLSESVLMLYAYDADHEPLGTGSGFVAFDDSTLVTNFHVIEGAYYVEANSDDGVQYAIEGVVYCDPDMDIAILSFEQPTGLPVLPIADSDEVKVGDTIYAIGSPVGLQNTVSSGIVSAIRDDFGYDELQFTAPISPGSSGGALLDAKGQVIGITSSGYDGGQNLNFAIPSAEFMYAERGDAELFYRIAALNNPMGNSIANYYDRAYLVDYNGMIYHAFHGDGIHVYDKQTGETTTLQGINGDCLSIYRGTLYCLDESQKRIASYDLETGEICANILANYSDLPTISTIENFFITPYGMVLVVPNGVVLLDMRSGVIGSCATEADTLAFEDVMVGASDTSVVFFSLTTGEEFAIDTEMQVESVVPDGHGNLYVKCVENEHIWLDWQNEWYDYEIASFIYRYDMMNDQWILLDERYDEVELYAPRYISVSLAVADERGVVVSTEWLTTDEDRIGIYVLSDIKTQRIAKTPLYHICEIDNDGEFYFANGNVVCRMNVENDASKIIYDVRAN